MSFLVQASQALNNCVKLVTASFLGWYTRIVFGWKYQRKKKSAKIKTILKMDADEHDRMMASEQGLPYLLSLYFRKSERSIPPFTGSGKMVKEILQLPERESIGVMIDSITENPEVKILLSELNEFFRKLDSRS